MKKYTLHYSWTEMATPLFIQGEPVIWQQVRHLSLMVGDVLPNYPNLSIMGSREVRPLGSFCSNATSVN